jgi:hypothetical protein
LKKELMSGDDEKRRHMLSRRVASLRRHLNRAVALQAAVTPAWAAALTVVLWRLLVHQWMVGVAMGCVCAALFVTWRLSARTALTQQQAHVLADRSANAGGLLLTRFETEIGAWEFELNQKIKSLNMPPLKLTRPLVHLALMVIFVALGCWVPLPADIEKKTNLAAQHRVATLEEKWQALALEEPTPAEVEKELQHLRDELAQNQFDAADWEASDQLEKQLEAKTQEASRELAGAAAAALALQQGLSAGQPPEALEREKEALEKALLEASDGQSESGPQALEQALQKAQSQGATANAGSVNTAQKSGAGSQQKESGTTPTKQQLESLEKALAERQTRLGQKPSAGKKGPSRAGEGKSGEHGDGDGSKSSQGEKGGPGHASRKAGTGGVGRGGDTAELLFGGEAQMHPERLFVEKLPDGNGGEAQALVGLSAVNPLLGDSKETAGTGEFTSGSSAATFREGPLRPKNQALVEKYFSNK